MGKWIDLTGQRFGRLTVVRRAGSDKHKHRLYECVCDCGAELHVISLSLKRGTTKSCGCLRNDVTRERATTHGHSAGYKFTTEFMCYRGMKKRCTNENNKSYKDYGGRGIKVCDRWLESFENFYADMGSKPSPKHSIDRIDVDGNYEPLNCRWATAEEQVRNKRIYQSVTAGVSWNKRDKRWISKISVNNKKINLGSFKEIERAIEARKQGEIKYWNKQPS